jgi:hypothetical protein
LACGKTALAFANLQVAGVDLSVASADEWVAFTEKVPAFGKIRLARVD